MEERITTLNPDKGKKGVTVSRQKYDLVRDALVKFFKSKPELTIAEMKKCIGDKVKGRLEGSLEWYVMAVKLDLEGRGVLERILSSAPLLHGVKN